MEQTLLTLALVLTLFTLLGSGAWVAFSLFGVGMFGIALFSQAPVGKVLATTAWGASHSWALAALPLFIWMGEILFQSRLSDDLFSGLSPWVSRLPGRLLHVNVLGCGIFAAVCGSSAATAATVGKMSLPELERRGYDRSMAIGTLAGSGTLGLLIPPSIILIVYGVATDQSIARLFIAGILPGVLLVALFMGYVLIWSLLNPGRMPPKTTAVTWTERIGSLKRMLPILVLIVGVIASVYLGIASPTDAGAVGVFLALVLSAVSRTLTRKTFVKGLMGATATSCMITFILAGAGFLSVAMGFTGIPSQLAQWIAAMQLSPHILLVVLTVFFLVLGCFLDGISVVVLTTSIVLPMIDQAGIDRIWFGIYLVIAVEMAQITPPVGFNLFVLQGLTGENILRVARSTAPFFVLLVVAMVLIAVFPQIVLWLPRNL